MKKDFYKNLSKEQLIYLIEQFEHSMFCIGEICVDESKNEINSHTAIKHIRDNIFIVPKFYDNKNLIAWVDKERGTISQEQYDKIFLGE